MSWLLRLGLATCLWVGTLGAHAGPDKVVKVLPHYLDRNGKHALSPSLFERDAYQAILRRHPDQRGGMQFDIQWKARRAAGRTLDLRLELVTAHQPKARPFTVDLEVQPTGPFARWKRVKLEKALMDQLGEIIAWRISLREGDVTLSERQSFLWSDGASPVHASEPAVESKGQGGLTEAVR